MNSAAENFAYRAAFFEQSEMLISVYDKDLNLVDANTAFLQSLHFDLKDVIGKNINDISPDCRSSGRYKIYEDIISTGKPVTIDQVQLHPKLGGIHIRLNAFKLGDGLGITSKDISDFVETINDLETFISKASHDVRSPISTVLGLINVAQNEFRNNSEALNYLKLIRQQTEYLDMIVTKITEISSLRYEEKNITEIDLGKLVESTIAVLRNIAGFNTVTFTLTFNFRRKFFSDYRMVSTFLHHLVHNAIVYRDERKKQCQVKVLIRETAKGMEFVVEDNGIGIALAAQKDLFNMFFRASLVSRGAGLGLYSVKHCVKKLGGHISVDSKPGRGSVFSVFLPFSKPLGAA